MKGSNKLISETQRSPEVMVPRIAAEFLTEMLWKLSDNHLASAGIDIDTANEIADLMHGCGFIYTGEGE